jgi:photosynthetic reaction center H subunit
MQTGAITQYIDVAQLVLYAFWIFFAGLVIYLRREDKREGYPLESDRSGAIKVQGFPAIPAPKTFKLAHGGTYTAPPGNTSEIPLRAAPSAPWPGAPLDPTGDPMQDGVGPAAYAERKNEPDLTEHGEPMIVPMSAARGFAVAEGDPDPHGMSVVGADGAVAGTVRDLWVDRAEPQIRYFEVDVATPSGPRRVLLPAGFARIDGRQRQIRVQAILAKQFAGVPTTARADQITRREEDRITAYYGGGKLYAAADRLGPIL